jgi:hypothetical protein
MAHLIRMPRAAWKRQPQGSADICWANPLTTNLKEVLIGGQTRTLLTQQTVTNSSMTLTAYETQQSWYAGSASAKLSFPVAVSASPLSLLSVYRVRSLSASSRVVGCSSGSVSGYSIAPTTTNYRALVNGTGATFIIGSAMEFYKKKCDLLTIAGTSGSRSLCFYENGVLSNTASAAYTVPTIDMTWGAAANASNSALADIALSAVWDRALTESEALEITSNPWQLFRPVQSRFYLIPSSGGVITLAVQDVSHSQSAETPSLTQAHVLALADSLHSHNAESPLFSQAYALSLAAAAHAHNADGSLTLTQVSILALADSTHGQSADNLTLASGLSLSPADATHSQGVESPGLIQAHILSLSDTAHSHQSDLIDLGQGFSLTLADSTHGHSAESPVLTVAFVLSILDAVHEQIADALSLGAQVTLVVSDALHAHYAAAASEVSLTPAGRVFIVRGEDRVFLILSSDRTFGVV